MSLPVNKSAVARVLVADDMSTNRMLVKQVLGAPEFEVLEADNGVQVLEILRREAVDVVLLDVMMPEMDGMETSKRIRGDLGLTLLPIIMVTALGSSDDVALAIDHGADDYVTKPFEAVELRARVRAAVGRKHLVDRLDDMETVLLSLARMVEARDANTGNHCDRLAHMGPLFGQVLGLSQEEIEALRRGGVLHDVGKLAIPDSILLKNGKLTDDEWSVMRKHTTIGAELCRPLKTIGKTTEIVLSHHEKWNGSGYPHGHAGTDIPLLARVFQIVDVYDGLSTERPYKPAFPMEKVTDIMRSETAAGFWDPDLMEPFLKLLHEQPQVLKLPDSREIDRSEQMFDAIQKLGVSGWYTEEKS